MITKKPAPLACSFCTNTSRESKKLIAGPTAYICEECIALCVVILANDGVTLPEVVDGQAAVGLAFDVGTSMLETRCFHCRKRWRTSEEAARAHLLACPDHPMRAVERERDELREGLRRMALLLPGGGA